MTFFRLSGFVSKVENGHKPPSKGNPGYATGTPYQQPFVTKSPCDQNPRFRVQYTVTRTVRYFISQAVTWTPTRSENWCGLCNVPRLALCFDMSAVTDSEADLSKQSHTIVKARTNNCLITVTQDRAESDWGWERALERNKLICSN